MRELRFTPETFKEQLSRVEMMMDGDETWDLSDNDRFALAALMASHAGLLEACKLAIEPGSDAARGPRRSVIEAAIRKAEGRAQEDRG